MINEKALAIAQDVLARLALVLFTPVKGYYLITCINKELFQSLDIQARPVIDELEERCQVCALGACFLSYIRLFNNVKLRDILTLDYYDNLVNRNMEATQSTIKENLVEIFGLEQLALIEIAHEMMDGRIFGIVGESHNSEANKRAYDFGARYPENVDRMRAIMYNIVENGGNFVP